MRLMIPDMVLMMPRGGMMMLINIYIYIYDFYMMTYIRVFMLVLRVLPVLYGDDYVRGPYGRT